ncbi:MAG: four helix bundle protein [Flavobacteriales bacterium]
MTKDELKNRTKKFALDVIILNNKIADDRANLFANSILLKQLIRSATSVGANHRASLRAKSKADFAYKINIVEEEADESCFWLELLIETNPNHKKAIEPILNEAKELTAIFTATGKTMKQNSKSEIRVSK